MGFNEIILKAAGKIALSATKKIVVPAVIKGGKEVIDGVSDLTENASNITNGRLKNIKDYWNEKQQASYLKLFEKESKKNFKEYLVFKNQCGFSNCIFVAFSPRATIFLDENENAPYSLLHTGNFYYLYSSFRNGLVGRIKVNDCKVSKRGIDFTNLQAIQQLEFYTGNRRIGEIQLVKRKHFRTIGTMSVSVGRVRAKLDPESNSWTNPQFEEISLESQIRNKIGTYSVIYFENMSLDDLDNYILAYCGILITRFLYHEIDFRKGR